MEYTKEQSQAIYSRGQDILVSAGAGAGKTRVLVTRIREMILDTKDPISAEDILVMTFTEAAAREMKERIVQDLSACLEKDPNNRLLREQIRVIHHADISTVHSFCNRLIRTHFQELGLDPSFRIGEEGELSMMKQDAMEILLEQAYAQADPDFLSLVEAYAPGRSDAVIEEMIGELYKFSRGFADARGWFAQVEKNFLKLSTEEGINSSKELAELLQQARREVKNLLKQVQAGLSLFGEDFEPLRFHQLLVQDEKMLQELLQMETYTDFYDYMQGIAFESSPRAKKAEKEWIHFEEIKEIRARLKNALQQIREEYFFQSLVEVRMEQKALYPMLHRLISLVEQFEDLYGEMKREKNVYDFDDLEHQALGLLVEGYEEDGRAIPSGKAREIVGHYRAIFVDEYQDTNVVQETILNTLKDCSNAEIFVVGDVKQSIYRFRQARPDLFIDRYERYEKGEGLKIELRDNFRSAPEVLEFCNQFFERYMSRDFGGIDYNEKVCLMPGAGGPMAQVHENQEALLLIDDEERELVDDSIDSVLAEAIMIGNRIDQLLQEGYDYDDMVILLRSIRGKGELIADYLEARRIPVLMESRTGYFETREIQVIMNYLSIIDNVYQDIPMASVMMSGIGGFTTRDLAELKLLVDSSMRRSFYLYDLMQLYLQEGQEEDLRRRINIFLEELHLFREKKQEMLLHELLWDIYEKTGLCERVLTMPHGEKRRQNLMMLLQRAEEYEKTMFKGLFYFIRYMDQMKTYQVEPGGAAASENVEKSVRILTIHKSKGLEFPVVFVSCLSKKHNTMDLRNKILFHPVLGIGMEKVDLEKRTKSPTLLKIAVKKRMEKEMLEEELRVLYVAMTRAQKKLILTGVVAEKTWEQLNTKGDPQLPASASNCLMDWVLPVLYGDGSWPHCQIYHFHQIQDIYDEIKELESRSLHELLQQDGVQSADAEPVRRAFRRRYAHENTISLKRKYSVSELKKLSMIKLPEEESVTLERLDSQETEIPMPAFLREEEPIAATTYGTMVHKIMELLPFEKIRSMHDLKEQMEILWVKFQDTDATMRKRVYFGMRDFFSHEVGQKLCLLAREGKLRKELPFTIGLDASMVYSDIATGESVVLQGVIDLMAETEEGLWLIDYKTDRIREGEEGKLLDRYQSQMLYYKLALERMFDKKVVRSLIYSFALGKFIEISWEQGE